MEYIDSSSKTSKSKSALKYPYILCKDYLYENLSNNELGYIIHLENVSKSNSHIQHIADFYFADSKTKERYYLTLDNIKNYDLQNHTFFLEIPGKKTKKNKMIQFKIISELKN